MRTEQLPGKCEFCGETFGNAAMARHLAACKAHKEAVENKQQKRRQCQTVFHIKVSAGPYWVHIEAAGSARLSDLDAFLRELWLECCGHLSCFLIGDTYYDSQFVREDSWRDRRATHMRWSLAKVLKPGMAFAHDYDFDTTTSLALKVVGEQEGAPKEKLRMMARNNPPELACAKCGRLAEEVCSYCICDKGKKAFFCAKCARNHHCEDDEDYFLPVVNSPRMGMCGYRG